MQGKGILQATLIGGFVIFNMSGMALAQLTTYIYTDSQGSPLAEADVSGNVVATFDYQPYGNQAMGASVNGPGYTSHVMDGDTSLIYMQQRYYDPAMGRFLSVDPVVVEQGVAGSFSRYWYANNNPFKFVDPDGRKIEFAAGAPKDFKANFARAIQYLNAKGAAANFAALQASKTVYVIAPSADRTDGFQTQYSAATKTITWADNGGITVADAKSGTLKTMSPAMAVGHEAEHGLNDEKGTFLKDNSTKDEQYDTAEEKHVIEGYENKAAEKLGEPIRTDHAGHEKKTCKSSTEC